MSNLRIGCEQSVESIKWCSESHEFDLTDESSSMPNDDQNTSLERLRIEMQQFVVERKWEQFHTPKNLASAIAIETAELMEHFQWLTPEQSLEMCGKIDATSPVAEEMADVLSYLLSLANALDIDITQAFLAKMAKNRAKYPVP